ncbi:MAG: hypothetical protein CBB68_14025 [Rhodospirillaceae bacterium TMED8]|nr:hypothetical protein [Magnetovibrio sp.]OUT48079.1 MAG: hypothetical protein CBB68_14025 [Rhodospirillaceae bacterium TMED8]
MQKYLIGPLTARNEMSNPSVGIVITLLRDLPEYQRLFFDAFKAEATFDNVGRARASYQRSLVASNSPFDQWYYGEDQTALGPSERSGFKIFLNKGDCVSCHTIGPDSAFFSDNKFHDIGYGWMRENLRQTPPAISKITVTSDLTLEIDQKIISSVGLPLEADLSRYEVTEKPADRGRFRTSSLRNIAITSPYMHDGGLSSLEEVIDFYDRGGGKHRLQDERIHPLNLSKKEKVDLQKFLESLTFQNLSCLIAETRGTNPDNLGAN